MKDAEDDVAVIGMACNFPGGEGLDSFWKVLLEGKNCVVEIPADRFDSKFWQDADVTKPGKTQTSKAALIDGFNEFDPTFFGITEVEADFMDPQQKVLLQCTYRALEDAGVTMETISGSRTGVYIGLMNRDYEMIRNNNPDSITHYNGTGTAVSVAASRISFIFNLTGPSFAIDSACSSSLVALHVACQAIKQGDCEMALCGAVNCIIEPRVFVALSKAKMISPEGTSKPFSIRADGYGRGEGCGVLILKPLKQAVKDCNKIWGIICKTAVNQDGHSVTPITKPSVIQQEELLRRIYSDADIRNVQYIEAHGTGTPVGDPTEAESISNVISKARPPGSDTLLIGSVKGNIGHTESAAGLAGLIKVLLMMKHETIVPSVYYSEDTSSVDLKSLNLKIPYQTQRWEAVQPLGRVAGVNSFGFGGTNAHVIVREHNHAVVPTKTWLKLLVFSAASEKSLILTITDTYQRLSTSQLVDLQSVSYTSACRRSHHKHRFRKTFSVSSIQELKHQLTSAPKMKFELVKPDVQVVFVFCGNGVSYRGMCRQLMREVPVFREKVREVERVFQSHEAINVSRWMDSEEDSTTFNQPNVGQPLLFAIQVGIAALLRHWGVKPNAVLGHSVGEVAAAHCSGRLSLDDAVKVLYHRSALQSKVTGGKMLVVSNVAVDEVLEVLSAFSGRISVAAYNSPRSCTLSGDAETVDILHERLTLMFSDKNLFLHILDVPTAYHSHMMNPILEETQRNIGLLKACNMECELFSTVSGGMCSDGDFCSGTYWAKNIREPVLFDQALRSVVRNRGNVVFVEIGPRRALQRYIHETLGDDTKVLLSVQPETDCETISSTLARLFELGVNIDWNEVYKGCEAPPTTLPVYQFDNTKKNVCFEALRRGDESSDLYHHGLELQMKPEQKEQMYDLSPGTSAYLWDHKNNNVVIVPGAFYVEAAYSTVMANLKPKKPASLLQLSVTFKKVLTLNSKSQKLKVKFQQSDSEASFEIQSSVATHASGTVRWTDQQPLLEEATICLDVIYRRCKMVIMKREIYSILSQAGFEYGRLFRQLDDVRFGDEFKEAVTTFQVPAELQKNLHEYVIHPVVLDYFMQMTAVVAVGQLGKQGFPSRIARIAMSGPLQEEMVMYLRTAQETDDFLDVCGCFATTEGNVLVELEGVRISFLDSVSDARGSLFFHNEAVEFGDDGDVKDHQIKAIVFEDQLGIGVGLRPYLCSESIFVESKNKPRADRVRNLVINSLNSNKNLNSVLFIWGVEDLSHFSSDRILEHFVTCCETFRQIVLAVRECKHSCAIRVITYRSTEKTADHVSPGFVLSGMTRACAAEMADLYFQLVDLASVTSEDISTLAHVIKSSKQEEIRISKGKATATRVVQTPLKDKDLCQNETHLSDFVLQTADPYSLANLSAIPANTDAIPVQGTSVEVQLTAVCVHSSDFFPVSTSHFSFGKTFYWNKHVTQKHKVLALDFSGTVTFIGRDVQKFEVGDRIASCYPVAAATKVVIPEAACYATKTFPFLRETPCVSYFILAWEILQNRLSGIQKRHKKLSIISSNPASALVKVLALTASRSGWNVSSLVHFTNKLPHFDAFVFLPPFDASLEGIRDNRDLVKHVVFVWSSHMSPSVSTNCLQLKNKDIYVHHLDVACVLQRANLQIHNQSIYKWLASLGFDAESVPLRKEPDQVKESYFTSTTVQQVIFNHDGCDFPSDDPPVSKSRELFKQRCVYIVTGGLSGLGLETVKFIAQNGGGCIAILSRSVPSEDTQIELDVLQKQHAVTVLNIQCDVSLSDQVMEAVSEIEQKLPSCGIKGVFHSAAVLHDALIESLEESLFRKVLKPKVCGALNLHFATLHNKLDFFVCYSSISSFIGNASQCNYAAANSFLDAFCQYRRNLGLAGQSINWGPLNLGLLLNKDHFQKFLEAKGMMIMGVREVHETLKKSLLLNRSQQVICKFNFKNLKLHVLSQNASLKQRLSALVETALRDEIHEEPKVQPSSSTYENLRLIVSEILSVNAGELDDDLSLSALGVDSMLAMTLQNKIFQETGVNVPLVIILDPNSTLLTLVNVVLNRTRFTQN